MDLEDWELLPKKSYKDLDLGGGADQEAMSIIRKTRKGFDMDYFICPTQNPLQETELSVVPTQDSPQEVPITWEPLSNLEGTEKIPESDLLDPLLTRFTSTLPQSEVKHSDSGRGYYDIDEMGSEVDKGQGGGDLRSKKEVDWDGDEKMNLWKMGLNGIGAICSFGLAAAAATICVLFLGHNNNNIQGCRNKNQILRFQIYSDDNKRTKEVVKHHATKLNEAISVMKSLPAARAQISFGGYYDGL